MCDVDPDAVIECADVASIYNVPLTLHREGLDAYLVQRLGLSFRDVDWKEWRNSWSACILPSGRVEVALVGKYTTCTTRIYRCLRQSSTAVREQRPS